MNEKLELNSKDCEALEAEWNEMLEKDKLAYGCTLIKVLAHLRSNLDDANKNPSYRRRERMRTKIALRAITGWIVRIQENFKKQ